MVTTNSLAMNILYITSGVILLILQMRVLNLLHSNAGTRSEQIQLLMAMGKGTVTVRFAPYSATVSTMFYGFGALTHVALYLTMSFVDLPPGHDGGMNEYLLATIHIRNWCLVLGAIASGLHKLFIYKTDQGTRGKPDRIPKETSAGWSSIWPARSGDEDKSIFHMEV